MIKLTSVRYGTFTTDVIVGGNTVGKTHFAEVLRKSGITTVDADDLDDALIAADPRFIRSPKEAQDAALGIVARRALANGSAQVLLTNQWGSHFVNGLGRTYPLPLLVARGSASRAYELARGRPGQRRLSLAELSDVLFLHRTYAQACFERTIWLADDQYLSDLFVVSQA